MFHIALMSKVHGALQFVVLIILIFGHGFSWSKELQVPWLEEENGVPEENPRCQVGTINPTDMP